MDWKTASSYYTSRLDDALTLSQHALNLANLPQAEVPRDLREQLQQEVEPTRRQRDRLKKGEFRIAVVGLEKAGKSTFINAWLQCDLLPAKGGRCTFTTTQIYSVASEAEQRLEIKVRSQEQFETFLQELEQSDAKEDLKTIDANRQTLAEVRRGGDLTFPFTRLEDIREPLQQYVANDRYAYAVLEARLYTNQLAQADGIVFYDVPGSDSGLAKHVDEAQAILADCDAVIVIQRFRSIREAELEIIQFTEQGDKNIKIAEKLFVFLSHIDSLGSAEALQTHIEEAAADWHKRANLPKHRIVGGSAGAYLVLNGLANPQTQSEVGSPQAVRSRLESLTHSHSLEELSQQATGIPEIKTRIEAYINTERVSVLQKRCEASLQTTFNTAKDIYHLVHQRYPENPEEAKQREEEARRIEFTQWWSKKWEQIKADLQDFYRATSPSNDSTLHFNAAESLKKLRQRYLQVLESEMQHLRQTTLEKRDRIFAANSNPVFDRTKANIVWREDLYNDVKQHLDAIADQLAIELQEQCAILMAYMTQQLWGSSQVESRLIENSDYYLEKLQHSLRVLYLRFARPVADALIRSPVKSDTRRSIIKNLGVDIEILDNYYSGDEPALRVLKRYANYGFQLLLDSALRQEVLGVREITSLIEAFDEFKNPEDEVIFEVETDIKIFEEYLQTAVFNAASLESYALQELQGLLDKFRDLKGAWDGVAMNEWYRGNPALLSELPVALQPRELNLEVSDRLRQLGTAIEQMQTASSDPSF
jgi:hypothetical protein